jgi:hypothetical protein
MTTNPSPASLRRRTAARLATALAIAAASLDASAVRLSPRGLGQVLIYPYYTARSTPAGAFNTLLTLTNTAADTKVVRVRFRESRNGREVAGVNVFLVPFDSWTGAVVPGSAGPAFVTRDASCTDPALGSGGRLAFDNAQYAGVNADGEDASLDRAAEGYVEVYEMGVVADATLLSALAPYRGDDRLNVPNCNAARAVLLDDVQAVTPPTGGLTGSASIINVAEGTLYPYDATAIDDFSHVPLWTPATDLTKPTLADVNPKSSDVLDASGYRHSNWDIAKGASPVDAVSAILMQDHLLNTFVLDAQTQSATDWIVTMPTKPFYVSSVGEEQRAARLPFESTFAHGGAPDYFGLAPTTLAYGNVDSGDTQTYDREGAFPVGIWDWGPNPPPPLIFLAWTANVVTFNNTNLFASTQSASIGTASANGWLRLAPYPYSNSSFHRLASTDTPPAVYFGLPMIGFMAQSYANGTLTGTAGPVLSNYGATSPHKGSTRIE